MKFPHICPGCKGLKKTDKIKESTKKLHNNSECKDLKPHSVWPRCMSCRCALYHEYESCIICKETGIVWG